MARVLAQVWRKFHEKIVSQQLCRTLPHDGSDISYVTAKMSIEINENELIVPRIFKNRKKFIFKEYQLLEGLAEQTSHADEITGFLDQEFLSPDEK